MSARASGRVGFPAKIPKRTRILCTVFPRIITGGDYFFFRTERGRLFEGGDYFKYCSQEVVL